MRIAGITTVYRRPALVRIVLDHMETLRLRFAELGVDLRVFVAVSPDDDPDLGQLQFLDSETVVEAKNNPLGAKWNAVQERAVADHDPDSLFVFGSDDLLSFKYVQLFGGLISYGLDYIGPDSCYFYDPPTGRASLLRGARIGAGRFFSRRCLETVGSLWPEVHIGPDASQTELLRSKGFPERLISLEDNKTADGWPIVIDVKTDVHRWPFSDFTPERNPMCTAVDGPSLLRDHFPHVADRIEALAG